MNARNPALHPAITPSCPTGMHEFIWQELNCSVDFVCYFKYTAEQEGSRDEPGEAEDAVLQHVYLRDVDILEYLSAVAPKQIERMEEAAIRSMHEEAAEHRLDMALANQPNY